MAAAFPVTLVVTTYNWPAALDLTLRSLARQSIPPDEIIVADDGSGSETRQVVRRWQQRLTVPLVHVWQADEGFRLARSRNRAIAAARGNYLIIVDGDMVLHRHFVADHVRAARHGCFIQGVRLLTGPEAASRMLAQERLDLGFFAPGIRRRRHTVRSLLLSRLVFRERLGQHAIRGVISTGYLVAGQRETRTTVSLPRPLMTRLQYAYDFWCAAIRNTCPTLGSAPRARLPGQLPG